MTEKRRLIVEPSTEKKKKKSSIERRIKTRHWPWWSLPVQMMRQTMTSSGWVRTSPWPPGPMPDSCDSEETTSRTQGNTGAHVACCSNPWPPANHSLLLPPPPAHCLSHSLSQVVIQQGPKVSEERKALFNFQWWDLLVRCSPVRSNRSSLVCLQNWECVDWWKSTGIIIYNPGPWWLLLFLRRGIFFSAVFLSPFFPLLFLFYTLEDSVRRSQENRAFCLGFYYSLLVTLRLKTTTLKSKDKETNCFKRPRKKSIGRN